MPDQDRSELEQNTARLIRQARNKQPEVVLDRLDTSVPASSDNRESSLGGYQHSPRSFSSRHRTGRTPVALELPSFKPQQLQPHKTLPIPPQPRRSPRQYIEDLIYSPRFGLRSPLSARSAAFLISLQHTFKSAVELCRRQNPQDRIAPNGVEKGPTDSGIEARQLEAQIAADLKRKKSTRKFEPWRLILIVSCVMAILAVVILSIVLIQVDRMGSKRASHWLMAASGSLVVLTAILMFAARRPAVEILTMALLGVLLCQCVMGDFYANKI
ncbi:uncharacterized protein PV09_07053 [Verruconis gallopava]|uniref:Uncharacterized protein n=1 Tax=Verruconis gallopava TaxID=253628 RepID=A0A0D2AQX7_9PEZI|nr:uncharacterized protein PV09_07053 [Verruconis gallopava]KIW01579.1 hypothetical protein PV09_07053 [Verruconis gallopava]